MLCFSHIFSIMEVTWYIRVRSLLYASWSLALPGLVEVNVILWLPYLFPLVFTATVPHSSVNDPSISAIYVPLVMALIMCCSVCSFGWNYFSHIWCSTHECLAVILGPEPDHLTVHFFIIYFLVFSESLGVTEYSFPLFWWNVNDLFYLVLVVVVDRMYTLVLFLICGIGREIIPILLNLGVAMVLVVCF